MNGLESNVAAPTPLAGEAKALLEALKSEWVLVILWSRLALLFCIRRLQIQVAIIVVTWKIQASAMAIKHQEAQFSEISSFPFVRKAAYKAAYCLAKLQFICNPIHYN